MIGLNLKLSKDSFFDRAAVIKAVDKERGKALSEVGKILRREARQSIKQRPRQLIKNMTPEEEKAYRARVGIAKRLGQKKPKTPRIEVASRPGQPPLSVTGLLRGGSGAGPGILYTYDRGSGSVVVGPVKLNSGSNAPATLEFGGTAKVKDAKGSRTIRVAARPYMGPALDRLLAQNKIPEAFRDLLSRGR